MCTRCCFPADSCSLCSAGDTELYGTVRAVTAPAVLALSPGTVRDLRPTPSPHLHLLFLTVFQHHPPCSLLKKWHLWKESHCAQSRQVNSTFPWVITGSFPFPVIICIIYSPLFLGHIFSSGPSQAWLTLFPWLGRGGWSQLCLQPSRQQLFHTPAMFTFQSY